MLGIERTPQEEIDQFHKHHADIIASLSAVSGSDNLSEELNSLLEEPSKDSDTGDYPSLSVDDFANALSQRAAPENPDISLAASVTHTVGTTTFETAKSKLASTTPKSSDPTASLFRRYLRERGLVLSPNEELDWSGKGQHITLRERDVIPLVDLKKPLGKGQAGRIDEVRCKRVRVARKTIKIKPRHNSIEESMAEIVDKEMKSLQSLSHPHIIRLVGSYLRGRNLSVLLYPVADYDLKKFMVDIVPHHTIETREALERFFDCLTHALDYIHRQNIAHVDIKPGNILVKRYLADWQVFITDFGISHKFIDDTDTESQTRCTEMYAAPEIGEVRWGRRADVFSLGCVFLEMCTVLANKSILDFKMFRTGNNDGFFRHNLPQVMQWIEILSKVRARPGLIDWQGSYGHDGYLVPFHWLSWSRRMVQEGPDDRPTTAEMLQPHPCCIREREGFEIERD